LDFAFKIFAFNNIINLNGGGFVKTRLINGNVYLNGEFVKTDLTFDKKFLNFIFIPPDISERACIKRSCRHFAPAKRCRGAQKIFTVSYYNTRFSELQ
jgi:hypothetical protein